MSQFDGVLALFLLSFCLQAWNDANLYCFFLAASVYSWTSVLLFSLKNKTPYRLGSLETGQQRSWHAHCQPFTSIVCQGNISTLHKTLVGNKWTIWKQQKAPQIKAAHHNFFLLIKIRRFCGTGPWDQSQKIRLTFEYYSTMTSLCSASLILLDFFALKDFSPPVFHISNTFHQKMGWVLTFNRNEFVFIKSV